MQSNLECDIKDFRDELCRRLGREKYNVWFSQSEFAFEQDHLKVLAPNSFMCGLIKKNFHTDINECAKTLGGSELTVHFTNASNTGTVKKDKRPRRTRPLSHTSAQPKPRPAQGFSTSCKHTLDTFVVGKKNEMAYNAAKVISESPGKVYNPLFIYGTYGVGKTHLLQAVCNQTKKNNPSCCCVYVSAEQFTNEYLNALKTSTMDKFRKKYRNADILAIDDIHFLAKKPSTQEEFLHTFNTINLADKQVVLASDAHPTMINELADNLVNRFVSGMVVRIDSPDYDTRIKICEDKINRMGLKLAPEIIEYVAESVTNSVRDIEGALVKLSAHLKLVEGKLSLAAVHYILGRSLPNSSAALSVESVLSNTAAFFSVSASAIKSSKKDRTTSLARAVTMYMLREKTSMSLPEIGRAMGNKNHTTVILACKKIKELVEKDNQVCWKVDGCRRRENINAVLKQVLDSVSR